MEATYDPDERRVRVTGDARQRLYDSGGFGEPLGGDAVSLSPVEAAYLLTDGTLQDVDGDGHAAFFGRSSPDPTALRVYTDLRDRGYYMSHDDSGLRRYGRGDHPADSSPERVAVADERDPVEPGALPPLLAVADDDGDVTYFGVEDIDPRGDFPDAAGAAPEPEDRPEGFVARADALREARYGVERDDAAGLLLSPVEAAYLGAATDAEDERRTEVYADLRDRGVCPRTGFKFGAEFRVYETTDDDHAGLLVSVVAADSQLPVAEVSRLVRLAHGVRKRAVFALVGDGVEYVAVARERP